MTEGKTSLMLEPQPEIQPEDRTTDIESDNTEDEDVIEATPSPCEGRVEPAFGNITPLRKRLPVSTAINNKLDQILENQKILFSMVRSLVREKNVSGFYAGEFGQRAVQILDKGNAEILNQGGDPNVRPGEGITNCRAWDGITNYRAGEGSSGRGGIFSGGKFLRGFGRGYIFGKGDSN